MNDKYVASSTLQIFYIKNCAVAYRSVDTVNTISDNKVVRDKVRYTRTLKTEIMIFKFLESPSHYSSPKLAQFMCVKFGRKLWNGAR